MKSNIVQLFMLALISSSSCFDMAKVEPSSVSIAQGDTLRLLCGTDEDWEHCKWYSPGGQECDFEWKWSSIGVNKQECSLGERVEFFGEYDLKECGLVIRNAQQQDAGLWTCHLEEFLFLFGKGVGRTVEATISVAVQAPTLPRVSQIIISTTAKSPTRVPNLLNSTTLRTTSKTPIRVQTPSTSTTSRITDSVATPISVKSQPSDVHQQYTKDAGQIEGTKNPVNSGTPSAVQRIEEAISTRTAVIGLACAFVLVGSVIAGWLLVRRCQRRKPDPNVAVAYDARARAVNDQRAMVNGQRPTAMLYRGNNYFPPNGPNPFG